MLKLKKTNLQNQRKLHIESEQQTHISSEKSFQQKLQTILLQKYLNHAKILQLLNAGPCASISGEDFVKIVQIVTKQSNLDTEKSVIDCNEILKTLILIPHDSQQVKNAFKKNKNMDCLLILVVLWQVRNYPKCWKYLSYFIQCYPTQIMINGDAYLQKWRTFINSKETTLKIQYIINEKIKDNQLKNRVLNKPQSNKNSGYSDNYINL